LNKLGGTWHCRAETAQSHAAHTPRAGHTHHTPQNQAGPQDTQDSLIRQRQQAHASVARYTRLRTSPAPRAPGTLNTDAPTQRREATQESRAHEPPHACPAPGYVRLRTPTPPAVPYMRVTCRRGWVDRLVPPYAYDVCLRVQHISPRLPTAVVPPNGHNKPRGRGRPFDMRRGGRGVAVMGGEGEGRSSEEKSVDEPRWARSRLEGGEVAAIGAGGRLDE